MRVDSAHDVMRVRRRGLDAIFAPKTVAVIGATERPSSVGAALMHNLLERGFTGEVIPVSLDHDRVLGIPAVRSVGDAPGHVDLAVIATPAATVPDVVAQCAAAGVGGAIVISAGFREVGPVGVELEHRVLENARRSGMRIVGPNCLGVISPASGLYASFASRRAIAGSVGFASQSGALCTSVLDWSDDAAVGFSHFISTGSMLDVGWSDIIYFLGDDPATKSIVLYIEGIGDASSFISAAREVALAKPIIVMKSGRSPSAAKAAVSHTGSLAGRDDIVDAALERCGVLRVNSVGDLFSMADVFGKQPRPAGRRLAVVTNAGGAGVIAVDELVRGGGELASLDPRTIAALDAALPAQWSHGNPVDVLGDADPQRMHAALEAVLADPAVDGLLVAYAPQAISDPLEMARQVVASAHDRRIPTLASWMGGSGVAEGAAALNAAAIPNFPYIDEAARAFNYSWRYGENLRNLYETPALPASLPEPRRADAAAILADLRLTDRTMLDEVESMALLGAYGLPVIPTVAARSAEDAARAAERLGYPVAVKLLSHTITHKSDVGGVRLALGDAFTVRDAYAGIAESLTRSGRAADFLGVTVQPMAAADGYELILGSTVDSQFGPVVLFGSGGVLVEVLEDRAVTLPPLNSVLARRLMERTKIYRAFKGVRGRDPVDVESLEELLVRFAALCIEQPRIREIDINPLVVSSKGRLVLDARIILHDWTVADAELPKSAIRPYPRQYAGAWKSRDGTAFEIRPLRPEDEPAVRAFQTSLSDTSVYQRFAHYVGLEARVAHERLARVCFIDYDRQMALVAASGGTVAAVGRLIRDHVGDAAEFALTVADRFQSSGLGTEMLRRLIDIAGAEGIDSVYGFVLAENGAMLKVCSRLGFSRSDPDSGGMVEVRLPARSKVAERNAP
jgi:acetyltransferase